MNPITAPSLKTELAELLDQQKTDFLHQDVWQLLYQRSDFYDDLLAKLWQQFDLSDRTDLALIAVGGYGRREMFPLSDLDILVLAERPVDEAARDNLNQLFNLLWDSKLQLGASVRTLDETIEIGKQEISVATNLFEGRFLLGNAELWQQLKSRLYQADFWTIEDFYQAKMAEKAERYARYHNTSYNLEPDLKHSPGGLRDLHLLSWIMLRHYGVYRFEALLNKGLLFNEEYQALTQAENLLFRMRFALHLQLKRYDNRLRFDRQLQLSEQLGYQGEGNQPVEAMMRDYFQATQCISQLTQLLLNSFEQTVLNPAQTGEKRWLDDTFYLENGQLASQQRRCFSQDPVRILDFFYHLTAENAKPNATTLRHLRIGLQKLASPLCDIPAARERFLAIFKQPQMVQKAIVPMHQLGVLTAYFPAWKGIVGLMQFDLFHLYTVDEHTIRVMLKLEQFLAPDSAEQHPLCHQLFSQNSERHLLFLAALLHDIAKGRAGEHEVLGEQDMRDFAELHGFSAQDADKMAWLVRQHLTMSITAQRRDIHDANVVKTFADIVGDADHLADLLCLTVADICATNETLWNDWKRSLLSQLYQFTTQQLVEKLDYQKEAQRNQAEALEQIKFALNAQERRQLQAFWQPCPTSYFLRNKPTQLVWHALHYLKALALDRQKIADFSPPQGTPLVLVSNEYARGATEIFLHCADQPQLFARVALALSQKKVSIHDAQIITADNGWVYDSFIITESDGSPLSQERGESVQQALVKELQNPRSVDVDRVKQPIKHASFKRETKVRFLPESQPNRTAFELFTLDREGLLAQISHIFNQQGLVLINAKISTIGERVEDFFVVATKNQCALSSEQQKALKKQLLAELV